MPKILYLVTEDWFFVSHFLPMAQAARDCGLQVAVATRVREDGERLKAEGFSVIAIESGAAVSVRCAACAIFFKR